MFAVFETSLIPRPRPGFCRHFPITSCSHEKRYQALHGFSVLQATESWAGPGNEASLKPHLPNSMIMIVKQKSCRPFAIYMQADFAI